MKRRRKKKREETARIDPRMGGDMSSIWEGWSEATRGKDMVSVLNEGEHTWMGLLGPDDPDIRATMGFGMVVFGIKSGSNLGFKPFEPIYCSNGQQVGVVRGIYHNIIVVSTENLEALKRLVEDAIESEKLGL